MTRLTRQAPSPVQKTHLDPRFEYSGHLHFTTTPPPQSQSPTPETFLFLDLETAFHMCFHLSLDLSQYQITVSEMVQRLLANGWMQWQEEEEKTCWRHKAQQQNSITNPSATRSTWTFDWLAHPPSLSQLPPPHPSPLPFRLSSPLPTHKNSHNQPTGRPTNQPTHSPSPSTSTGGFVQGGSFLFVRLLREHVDLQHGQYCFLVRAVFRGLRYDWLWLHGGLMGLRLFSVCDTWDSGWNGGLMDNTIFQQFHVRSWSHGCV